MLRVPWTAHCYLLPHPTGVMNLELWFSNRCIRFIKMALNSDNVIARTIINVSLNGTHCIMAGNWRHLRFIYRIEEGNVVKSWHNSRQRDMGQ